MSCKEQMEAPKQALQLESSSKSFLIVTIILSIIAYIFGTYFIQLGEGSDWNEIRCQPHIMPIAGLYGYDVQENFNYCMNSQFNEQAKQYLGPVYQLFGGFVGVLGTLVEVSQKVKLAFATMYGGVKTIMQEFTERLKLFFIRIEVMSQRMKMLMYRVYSVMFAVIFMATSGLTAVSNFGGTVLFDVIDTFCFDPITAIHVQRKGFEGAVSISNVQLGDVLEDGGRVTSVFSFLADGQAMVRLCSSSHDCSDAVLVSTNHYVQFNNKWIRSDEHPLAEPAGRWAGGTAAPLICLNTTTNCIPVNGFLFRDYDETAAAHYEAIRDIHEKLNGSQEPFQTQFGAGWTELLPSISPLTRVRSGSGSGSKAWRAAIGIDLGDTLAGGPDASANIVVGKISHFIHQVCKLPYNGNYVGAGTLIYERDSDCWVRAGDIYPVYKLQFPLIFNSFITLPGSVIELEHDYLIRDYLEIVSPDTEAPYARALAALNG